jgi:hypothetical protein
VFRKIELPWGEFLRVMMPSIAGCLVMTAAVLGFKAVLPAHFGMPARLGLFITMGAVAYVLVAGGLSYPRRHALKRAIGMLRSRAEKPA